MEATRALRRYAGCCGDNREGETCPPIRIRRIGGGVQLGAALCDLRRLDRGALADLIASRTVPSPSNEHRSLHLGRGASVAPVAERSASTATTYEPSQLAEQLGYAEVSRPGSAVRDYLRRTYPEHPNGERWALNEEQAADVLANVPRKR